MVFEVSPVFQVLPVSTLELIVSDPPEQKVSGPPGKITGCTGSGLIVTFA
jgi:hypothetical protein